MMLQKRRRAGRSVMLVLGIVLVAGSPGCSVQLAPSYTPDLVDGLSKVNTQAMTFFASVKHGTTADKFFIREGRYNSLIGQLDALKTQSDARPEPSSFLSQVIGGYPEPGEGIAKFDTPTGDVIQTMSDALTKMKETDRKQGLTGMEVAAFRGVIVISMDQALTYERALER